MTGDTSVKKKTQRSLPALAEKNKKGLSVHGEVMAKTAAILNRLVRRSP